MGGRLPLALLLACAAAPVAAQTPGVPVMNGSLARGVSLAGMAGFGVGDSEGTAVGLAGTLGMRRVAISGMVSRVSVDGADSYYGAGGAITVKVAGGPLVPLSLNLQAGAGYSKPLGGVVDLDVVHVPVGLGISWIIPQPVVALKPWLAPRLDVNRVTGPDPLADPLPGGPALRSTSTATNFGLSGGLTFGFLNGMAIDVAFDRVFADGVSPTTLGVGLSWNLR